MSEMPLEPCGPSIAPAAPLLQTTEPASHWRFDLPSLTGSLVTVREPRPDDARALFTALSTWEVARYLSPPPPSVGGFERFIEWTRQQRLAGRYAGFVVVPHGTEVAVGLFQIRALDVTFGIAEWGFALAPECWGSGMFQDAAHLVAGFAFDTLGVRRLEARPVAGNDRGNAALRKLGAVKEGVLRAAFVRNGEYLDQAVWSILREEWRARASVSRNSRPH